MMSIWGPLRGRPWQFDARQLDVHEHRVERILDLVRDAAGNAVDRRQPLGGLKLALESSAGPSGSRRPTIRPAFLRVPEAKLSRAPPRAAREKASPCWQRRWRPSHRAPAAPESCGPAYLSRESARERIRPKRRAERCPFMSGHQLEAPPSEEFFESPGMRRSGSGRRRTPARPLRAWSRRRSKFPSCWPSRFTFDTMAPNSSCSGGRDPRPSIRTRRASVVEHLAHVGEGLKAKFENTRAIRIEPMIESSDTTRGPLQIGQDIAADQAGQG